MRPHSPSPASEAAGEHRLSRGSLPRRLLCRIFGHRWRFLHAHPQVGKIYRCGRCGQEAVFVR